jgi:hypothetical protein
MIAPGTVRAARISSFARRKRRRGAALMAFGGAGLAILAILAVLIVGPLGSLASAAASVEDQRARVVAMLPAAEAALRSASTTAIDAGSSLRASGNSARDGSALLVQLASAMDSMSSASRVEILGSRPFGSLSDELTGVATRSRSLAANLDVAAEAIAANVGDSQTAASDLSALADEVAALHGELAADDRHHADEDQADQRPGVGAAVDPDDIGAVHDERAPCVRRPDGGEAEQDSRDEGHDPAHEQAGDRRFGHFRPPIRTTARA